MILRQEIFRSMMEMVLVNERMMAITLKLEGETMSIIQVYAPHRGRPIEEKIEFMNELQLLVDRVRGEKKIIMGDLNVHVGTRGVGEESTRCRREKCGGREFGG